MPHTRTVNDLPRCEVCHGPVYRRLVPIDPRKWTGPLWHYDMTFLDADDPGHEPTLTDAPAVIPLPGVPAEWSAA